MQTPNFVRLFFITVVVAGIVSCKGPEGPQGPIGAQGTAGVAGATGAQGPKGDQGNANVVTTAWRAPAWSNYNNDSSGGYVQFYLSGDLLKNPAFTEEAMSAAAIHTYFKVQALENTAGKTELKERVSSQNGATSYFKIPDTENEYSFCKIFYGDFGTDYCPLSLNIYVKNGTTDIPQLAGKRASFFADLVKDIPQVRHVIVYGNPSGRMAEIDWNNYDEVKEALGLED